MMERIDGVTMLDTDTCIKTEKPDTCHTNSKNEVEIMDNTKQTSHRAMSEDPVTHTVTDFSIAEILKPSFGQKHEIRHMHVGLSNCVERYGSRKDGECGIEHDNKVKDFKDLPNGDQCSHSLLFDFRCLNSRLSADEEHDAISHNVDSKEKLEPTYKRVKISSGQTFKTFSINSIIRKDKLKFFEERENCRKPDVEANDSVRTSLRMMTSREDDSGPRKPALWPAWVYCTRYSDRPSAGPRSRKVTRRSKRSDEKRPRTAFTSEQLGRLRSEFDISKYLTEQRRKDLARSLDLSEAQIKIWYQNKRAKIKKASGSSVSSLALHLMAQGLYNHKAYVTEKDFVTVNTIHN